MKISGRNQLKGFVKAVQTDDLMGKVVVEIQGDQTVTAIITRDAVDDLQLKAGDQVNVLVKATSAMIIK
ncbi:MAG: TOBE domain-containing protein [Ignavibacteriales bacterium]